MFEFDPNESKSNKQKHGNDFYTARRLWKNPRRVEIPARWVDEPRLDQVARRLGVTRQSVIKVFISEKLKEEDL